MAFYAVVKLEGYPEYWTVGDRIIDIVLSRASNEDSSNVKVTLADPGNTIAARLIEHTEKTGGLQQLPGTPKAVPVNTANGNQSSGPVTPTNGDRVPSGSVAATELAPQEKAFLDMLAYTEGVCIGSKNNGYDTVGGYGYSIQNYSDHPVNTGEYDPIAHGFESDVCGRYQFKSTTWNELGMPDFSPASQDRAAIMKVKGRGGHAALMSGDIQGAIAATNQEWASLPGSPYGQPVVSMEDCLKVYNERLAYYQGTQGATSNEATQSATDIYKSMGTDTGSPAKAPFKGKKLKVTIGDNDFEFFHQGTETEHTGKTTVTGQGGRWVANRRKRNRTHADLSLKALAEKICREHGLSLDWKADIDPQYEFIDQSGISDYELLLRECKANGLFVTEGDTKDDKGIKAQVLTIKSLRSIQDSKLVLAPGNNLISWKITDKPVNKEDKVDGAANGTAIGITDPKVVTDMMTGKMTATTPEVDPAKSPASLTGNPAEKPTGTLKPGHEAVAKQNKARVARVKGLPSTFTVPLSTHTLALKPLDAVHTSGLPGKLSRIWMIDSVTHNLAQGTTQLNVFSPVEVLDQTPASIASKAGSGGQVAGIAGQYVSPITGGVGDWFDPTGSLVGRIHYGIDFSSGVRGNPIYAAADGQVVYSQDGYPDNGDGAGGGYGNRVEILHPDGYATAYSHLQQGSILVHVGQQVRQGQQIGGEGNSGSSYGEHLHFAFHNGQNTGADNGALNPEEFGWKYKPGNYTVDVTAGQSMS